MYSSARAVLTNNVRLLLLGVAAFCTVWTVLLPFHPEDRLSSGVVVWWMSLYGVSLLNICGWRLAAAALVRRQALVPPDVYLLQRRQLLLAAVYVFGCAFRSILPRADVQRIGLFDTWVSSVVVGRSVATVAELCFTAQWALLLHKIAEDAGACFWMRVARMLVPLIAVAQICSWTAVLTTSYLGNAFEESIWALAGTLVIVGFLALRSRTAAAYRPFVTAGLVLGVAYVTFMCTVDIPMYVARWLADEARGRVYLSLGQGLWDVGSRWTVTYAWEAWQTEIPWMSLYFSVGVWCSIALVHAPRLESKLDFPPATARIGGLVRIPVEAGGRTRIP
jgi:hypothetical protein